MAMNPNLFAGLGPFAGLTQAGTEMLSRGVGGLFGIKDPELERNRVLSQVDYNDPASLQAAAQELARAGYVDQAVALAGQGRQIAQQTRQFGLEEERVGLDRRRVAATEQQLKDAAANQAERLALSKEELELKKKELKNREDLTAAQVDKMYAEIEMLDKGNYHIVEQKGGDLGTTTVGFIAINKRNPEDQKIIPLVSSAPIEAGKPSVVPPKAAWQYVPGKGMVKNEDK
jgi:hypothetical protein